MPDFNTFRTNKLLLGQVLVARQNVDLSATENDHLEVRQFLHELEEKKRKDTSTLFLRFIGFFTGKVSWGLMIGVAAGIAAMFGAPSIVAAITGKSAFDCGN